MLILNTALFGITFNGITIFIKYCLYIENICNEMKTLQICSFYTENLDNKLVKCKIKYFGTIFIISCIFLMSGKLSRPELEPRTF